MSLIINCNYAEYNPPEKGCSCFQTTITLASADWANEEQTVTVEGVKASSAVVVSPDPVSIDEYVAGGVYCSAQAEDSLTFMKTGSVASDLTVNVLVIQTP